MIPIFKELINYALGNSLSCEDFYQQGLRQYTAGDHIEALKNLIEAVKLNDNYKEAWLKMGHIYHEYKEYKPAMQCYSQAAKLDEKDHCPVFNKGLCYFALGDLGRAVHNFNKCLSINPRFKAAFVQIARIQLELGEADKALKTIEKALYLDKNYKEALQVKLELLKPAEERKLTKFNKIIELDPCNKIAWKHTKSILDDRVNRFLTKATCPNAGDTKDKPSTIAQKSSERSLTDMAHELEI
jgi:tetratricopeptide (TPR) repeat protein